MNFEEDMVCPACEVGKLKTVSKDLEFEYKCAETVIANCKIFACSVCEESFTDPKDVRKLEKILADHRRTVDGLLTSKEIRRVRNEFKMTQVEFAKALRVGEKNFARYETGQSAQGYAMDNLLRVLRGYPYTIRAFHKEWPGWKKGKVIEITAIHQKRRRRRRLTIEVDSSLECRINDEKKPKVNAL